LSKLVFAYFKKLYFHIPQNNVVGGGTIQQLSPESPDLSAPCPWLLRLQVWCLGKFLSFYGLTNFMLKWIWCGYEASYDDFCLWDI